MRRLAWVLPLAFFFLNPTFACGPAPDEYHFGAQEMSGALAGSWAFTIQPQDGSAAQKVTLKLDQASGVGQATQAQAPARSLIRAAHACGGRTLVKSAGACIDVTTMPVTVSVLSGDAVFTQAPSSGTFIVYGTQFFQGSLSLNVGPYVLELEIFANGGIVSAHVGPGGALGTLPVSAHS